MKTIAKIEEFIQRIDNGERISLAAEKINPQVYWAYRHSKKLQLDMIDFSEVICTYDVKPIVEALKEYEIESFTISSTLSSLLELLWEFRKNGCKIEDLTMVSQKYDEYNRKTRKMEQAVKPGVIIRL